MLLRTLIAAAAVAASALPSTAQSASPVTYSISPVMNGDSLAALAVEIRLAGDADGETRLQLPREWAGVDSLWRNLDDVRVEGASVRMDGAEARILAHRPGAALTIRYRVRSAYTGDPAFEYQQALPIILPGWFFFHGEGVFATVEGRDESPGRFSWRGFPAGWKVASDLDHLERLRPGTVNDVVESVAIGAPDLALIEREVDGAPLRIAIRGAWDFTPGAFADAVEAVVRAENAFWGDEAQPFLVPMAPLGGPGGGLSYIGAGRDDAFSVASTTGFPLKEATHFLAHEYMHSWIGRRVGGASAESEGLVFWLTEGFTDFYAGRTLVRAGLWTPAELVADLNRVLLRNAISPVRSAPNTVIAERFWTDPDVGKLPYERGFLLAYLLDHRIRQHTGGRANLDDVMRAQRALATRNDQAGTRVDAGALFPRAAREAVGLDLAPELARHVERGEPVTLPADLFGACARVETVSQPTFDRGFDIAATNAADGVVAGVDSLLPAYAAGLRNGMQLVRREGGSIGDSGVEITYVVQDGGAERRIRYRPEGRARITFQRAVLTPEAATERCARLMGGRGDAPAEPRPRP